MTHMTAKMYRKSLRRGFAPMKNASMRSAAVYDLCVTSSFCQECNECQVDRRLLTAEFEPDGTFFPFSHPTLQMEWAMVAPSIAEGKKKVTNHLIRHSMQLPFNLEHVLLGLITDSRSTAQSSWLQSVLLCSIQT